MLRAGGGGWRWAWRGGVKVGLGGGRFWLCMRVGVFVCGRVWMCKGGGCVWVRVMCLCVGVWVEVWVGMSEWLGVMNVCFFVRMFVPALF